MVEEVSVYKRNLLMGHSNAQTEYEDFISEKKRLLNDSISVSEWSVLIFVAILTALLSIEHSQVSKLSKKHNRRTSNG